MSTVADPEPDAWYAQFGRHLPSNNQSEETFMLAIRCTTATPVYSSPTFLATRK